MTLKKHLNSSNKLFPLGASALTVFLGALDTYVIVSVLTTIMTDMGVAINHITRITPAITGYLLGYTVAMPLFGQSSDKYGRRIVLQVGLAIFMVGSVITACANDVTVLVIGRAVQGLAGGALLPVSMALIADLWKDKTRSSALGIIGGAQELGSLVGPIYGFFILELFYKWNATHNLIYIFAQSWRYIFWLNIPLAVFSMILIHYTIPADKARESVRIDFVGAVFIAVSLGLTILGLYNPEDNGKILPQHGVIYLVFAVIFGIIFLTWEIFSSVRIIDPKKIDPVPFLCCLLVSLCVGAALMVTMVDIQVFTRGLGGYDERKSVWFLAKFLIAVPIGAVLGGYFASKADERIIVIVGMLIGAIGYWSIPKVRATTITADEIP